MAFFQIKKISVFKIFAKSLLWYRRTLARIKFNYKTKNFHKNRISINYASAILKSEKNIYLGVVTGA